MDEKGRPTLHDLYLLEARSKMIRFEREGRGSSYDRLKQEVYNSRWMKLYGKEFDDYKNRKWWTNVIMNDVKVSDEKDE